MPKKVKIPAVKFNLKDISKPDKETLIYLFFRYSNIRLKYSTGEKIKPRYWDNKSLAKYTKNHPEYSDINTRLNDLTAHVKGIFKEFDYGKKISLEDFKLELDYRSEKKERPSLEGEKVPTLFEFIDQFCLEQQNDPTKKRGTWKKFITVQSHLKKYSEEKKEELKKELSYDDIDWHFRKDFLNWLYEEPRNHSINNAAKIFEVLKQFMQESIKLRYHTNLTFLEKNFGVKRVKTKNKVRLDFQEIEQLIQLDLSTNPRLEKVRDLFVVGCYTGLRFSDWHKVKKGNIILDKDGEEQLEILTQKTTQRVLIPILSELKAVIDKYDYNLPSISAQKFNDYIKEVCELANLDSKEMRIYSEGGITKQERLEKYKMVSSHCARRSFASNFYQLLKKPSLLMQITGHTTEKQFFEYIDLSNEEQAKEFAHEVKIALNKRYLRKAN